MRSASAPCKGAAQPRGSPAPKLPRPAARVPDRPSDRPCPPDACGAGRPCPATARLSRDGIGGTGATATFPATARPEPRRDTRSRTGRLPRGITVSAIAGIGAARADPTSGSR